jgi:hypothetical protein
VKISLTVTDDSGDMVLLVNESGFAAAELGVPGNFGIAAIPVIDALKARLISEAGKL